MKKPLLTVLLLIATCMVGAQTTEWRNAEVNAVNRLPMHTAFRLRK